MSNRSSVEKTTFVIFDKKNTTLYNEEELR